MSTFIELGVGFNPELAARDNVVLNGIMLGLTPREARERFEEVVRFAELEEFVDLKLKNYSSGMHVRLAFSVMIQVQADILLVDEILAVGDASFQQKCFDMFFQMRDEGKTVLFVTHDMAAVQRFCHRAMLLERGQDRGDRRSRGRGRPLSGAQLREQSARSTPTAWAARGPATEHARVADAWIEDEHGARPGALPQGRPCTSARASTSTQPIEDPAFAVIVLSTPSTRTCSWPTRPLGREHSGHFEAGETRGLHGLLRERARARAATRSRP